MTIIHTHNPEHKPYAVQGYSGIVIAEFYKRSTAFEFMEWIREHPAVSDSA